MKVNRQWHSCVEFSLRSWQWVDDGSDEQYIVPDQLHNGATHFPRVKTFVHRHLFPTVTLSQSNKPSWNLMAEHGGCFTYWAFWSSMCLALRCLTCGRCREVPSSAAWLSDTVDALSSDIQPGSVRTVIFTLPTINNILLGWLWANIRQVHSLIRRLTWASSIPAVNFIRLSCTWGMGTSIDGSAWQL